MDKCEINAVLDDIYNFSELNDGTTDRDLILNDNLLIGITHLISDDSEECVMINSENVDDTNLRGTNNELEIERIINTEYIDNEYNETNEESTSRDKKTTKSASH